MNDNNLIAATVLLGGPAVSMAMGCKHPMQTEDGRVLVCMAQAGECRHNSRHYESGMSSERAWSLPQIEPGCDRRCGYRMEVADPSVDTVWTRYHRQYDLAGFEYYKRAQDACGYNIRLHAQRKEQAKRDGVPIDSVRFTYSHDSRTCPECSKPQVVPANNWVDTVREKLKAASRVEMSRYGYNCTYYDNE